MADPIHALAPDDSGSVTLERYEYQVHVAVQAVLQMLAGLAVCHVTCEHIEDIIAARGPGAGGDADLEWDFQQVKSRDAVQPWTLADVLAAKPLRSLWRTHAAVQGLGLTYRLTAALEGLLDPGDANVMALASGQGAKHEQCLTRVMRHLKADRAPVVAFLDLLRVQQLPRRADIEVRNIAAFAELGDRLSAGILKGLYDELLRRARDAMQGKLGPRWPLLITDPNPSDRVQRKRLTAASVVDIQRRLLRPDHVLLGAIAEQLTELQTPLVRKLRAGAASPETLEDAQRLRAHADHHRLSEQALGTWPQDHAIEADLDQRLLLTARRLVVQHRDQRPRPADTIFNALQSSLSDKPERHDRHPLYAQDDLLLMGRACALSDACHFGWGNIRDDES